MLKKNTPWPLDHSLEFWWDFSDPGTIPTILLSLIQFLFCFLTSHDLKEQTKQNNQN